jgi:hypothetical protein
LTETDIKALDQGFEALRARHSVRELTGEEEGTGVDRLPEGVYGFTYSPAAENMPLFKERRFRNYEVHKLAGGATLILGFVTPTEAQSLEAGETQVTLHLYPQPETESTRLVAIATDRVLRHGQHSQRGGAGLEILVGSLS